MDREQQLAFGRKKLKKFQQKRREQSLTSTPDPQSSLFFQSPNGASNPFPSPLPHFDEASSFLSQRDLTFDTTTFGNQTGFDNQSGFDNQTTGFDSPAGFRLNPENGHGNTHADSPQNMNDFTWNLNGAGAADHSVDWQLEMQSKDPHDLAGGSQQQDLMILLQQLQQQQQPEIFETPPTPVLQQKSALASETPWMEEKQMGNPIPHAIGHTREDSSLADVSDSETKSGAVSRDPVASLPPYPGEKAFLAPESPFRSKSASQDEETEEESSPRAKSSDDDRKRKSKKKSATTKKPKETESLSLENATLRARVQQLEHRLHHLNGVHALSVSNNEIVGQTVNDLRLQLMKASHPPSVDPEDDINAKLQHKDLLLHQIDEENKRLIHEKKSLFAQLEKSRLENEEMLKTANSGLLESIRKTAELEAQVKQLKGEKSSLEAMVKERNEWLKAYTQRPPSSATAPMDQNASEGSALLLQVDGLNQTIAKLRLEKEALITSHQAELQKLKQEASKVDHSSVRDLETRNNHLERELSRLTNDNALLSQKCQQAEDNLISLGFQKRQLLPKNEDVDDSLAKAKAAVEQRIGQLEKDYQKRVQELQTRIETQAKVEITSIVSHYQENIRSLQKQLDRQMKTLDTGVDQLLESKSGLEHQLQKMKMSLEDKIQENNQLEEVISKLRAQRAGAEQRATEEKSRASKIQAQNERLELERKELQEEVQELTSKVHQRLIDQQRLERDLREQRELGLELQRKCDQLGSGQKLEEERVKMQRDFRSKLDHTFQEQAARLREKELHLSKEAAKFSEAADKLKRLRDHLKRKSKELQSKERQLSRLDQKSPEMPRSRQPESKLDHPPPQTNGLPPAIHKFDGFSDQALSMADLRFPPTASPPVQLPATFNLATSVPRTMTRPEISHFQLPEKGRPVDLPPLEPEPFRPDFHPSLPPASRPHEPAAPARGQGSDHLDERKYQLLHLLLQKSSFS